MSNIVVLISDVMSQGEVDALIKDHISGGFNVIGLVVPLEFWDEMINVYNHNILNVGSDNLTVRTGTGQITLMKMD